MPTFTPPTYEGISKAASQDDRPMRNLMRYYGGMETGFTVYKDQADVWHKVVSPTDYDLAAAKVVYLGGHEYTLTSAEEADLISGGFGAFIKPDSITENFNKADGALGPQLVWTEKLPNAPVFPQVFSNQLRYQTSVEGSYESISEPATQLSSPDCSQSWDVVQISRTGSGNYHNDAGFVARYVSDGGLSYRGYAASCGISSNIIPGVEIGFVWIFRVQTLRTVPSPTIISVTGSGVPTLPGTFTFTVDGPNLTATLVHQGGSIEATVVDEMFNDGKIGLGFGPIVPAGNQLTYIVDNYTASIL